MPTYILIAGTRPEVIKLSPVAAALRRRGARADFCAVGQHGDLLTETLAAFGEVPRYTPIPFRSGRTPQELLAEMLIALPPLLAKANPDGVIVQGDTTTAFGGALAAFYCRFPLIHIEAGLRTYDRFPFPEEAHRRMIAPLAALHLCPTDTDADTLRIERVTGRIAVTGNSGLDGLRMILARPAPALPAVPGRLILCTIHRRENAALLPSFLAALKEIANAAPDHTILFPAHPSPAPTAAVGNAHPRICILPPLSYPVCAHLLPRLTLLLTDSGGLQEEAAFLGVPTLVLREKSERGDAPSLRIIGSDPAKMVTEAVRLLTDEGARTAMRKSSTRYGDGHAAERMAGEILVNAPSNR
ncbi:MAG: UDP-N-acetylglucosamine 2-epimerase (non-hydrolyzing) [Clostridia bacterium]|nr:UDP-N-acetylglucosamine 2-epimerase (non-hydrolyzing) [Clostridia bacterium]